MFSLTLTEFQESHAPSDIKGMQHHLDMGKLVTGTTFTHFTHNFRELPADKLARIQAILAEPPAPQRKTRSDAGKPKTPKTTTPPQPTLDIGQ